MIGAFQMLVVLLAGIVRAYPEFYFNNKETEQFKYCIRECDGQPRNCYYKLHFERSSVLAGACRKCAFGNPSDCRRPQCITANGRYRALITVNRQLPAPAIHVCKGDRIIADVVNLMPDAPITVHWHGIKQNGFQYDEGVPNVSQCPIMPGNTFRYDFVVKEAGTFYYYSHIGVQRMDGAAGALIVRDVEDSQSHLYTEDLPQHVIFINDWFIREMEWYITGFNHPEINKIPETFLINGRGLHWNGSIDLPLAEFTVRYCKKYRFRLIGGTGAICAVAIIFQGHKPLVISADGNLKFLPKLVDTVILNAGDRFDVVIDTKENVGTYNIFAESVDKKNCPHVRQMAILRYRTSKAVANLQPPPPPNDFGIEFNSINSKCDDRESNKICISYLEGQTDAPAIGNEASEDVFISFNFYYYDKVNEDLFIPGTYQPFDEPVQGVRLRSITNNITFKYPQSNLITRFNDIPKNDSCDSECHLRLNEKPCCCTNIYDLPYKTFINMIMYDDNDHTTISHPFYLHGFNFYVIGEGVFPSVDPHEKQEMLNQLMDNLKNDKLILNSRPQRDTITVPSKGYVLTRFYTDNPGLWLLHCHFIFHLYSGMAILFRVGEESDLPPVPEYFPTCDNFIPET